MRVVIMSSVIVVTAVGCIADEPVDEVQQAISCPDPDRCLLSNGGGVYTEELGFAGIGADQFMITRFIDRNAGGVDVRGRYYDAASGWWLYDTTSVLSARYLGHTYWPVSVVETLTKPTWTLFDSDTGATITVSDADVANVELQFKRAGGDYWLSFDSHTSETSGGATIQEFNMLWRNGAAAPTQYCFRAPPQGSALGAPDPVVFQQGIGVNPVDAGVVRDSSFVTLSCRHGAPATARLWGYKYRGAMTQTALFDMALPMKRASYCGDGSFYTRANTPIAVWDDLGIQSASSTDPALIEAAWGPNGATCVNWPLRRHRQAEYPDGSGSTFSRWCADGHYIPPCTSQHIDRMTDQASPPAP